VQYPGRRWLRTELVTKIFATEGTEIDNFCVLGGLKIGL